MGIRRRKISLTIWQWENGECTAFLDALDVGGEHLDLAQPRVVAQTTVRKNAPPAEVLRSLADWWAKQPVA